MKKRWRTLEEIINNYSIKKKLILFYVCCVLLPLFITDSVILGIIYNGEINDKKVEMAGIADAVESELVYNLEEAAKMVNAIYLSRYINEFLDQKFESGIDFFEASLDIQKKNFYEIGGNSSSRCNSILCCACQIIDTLFFFTIC